MNKEQALAMLKFIADLYQIIQAPEPEPVPATERFTEDFTATVKANTS